MAEIQDDDLTFPDERAVPDAQVMSEADADAEAAQLVESIERNRRAVARGVIAGFVVASITFFAIAYAFPNVDRDLVLTAMSLGVGAFVGLGVWATGRSKKLVLEPVAGPTETPDASTRDVEAKGRAYRQRTTRALLAGAASFFAAGPMVLFFWSRHLEAENELRSWYGREEIGAGRSLMVLFAAGALGALVTYLMRPRIDVLAELGGIDGTASTREAGTPLSAAELADLRAVAGAERRRQMVRHAWAVPCAPRRNAAALRDVPGVHSSREMREGAVQIAAGVSFVAAAAAVVMAGGGALLAALAGLGAAVVVHRMLDARGATDKGGDLADTLEGFGATLATTGSITLEGSTGLEASLGRMLGVTMNRWTLTDGGGAALASASEIELPLWRRWLPFRTRTLAVRCVDGRPLELTRPGTPFADAWTVRCDGVAGGTLRHGFFGTLVASDAGGAERFVVKRMWLSRWSRVVTRQGQAPSRITWRRPGWLSSALDHPGLQIELPRDATIADRRLLLAAGLVLDLDRL